MKQFIRNTLLITAMALAGSTVAMADQAENELLMKAFQDAGFGGSELNVNVQDGVATVTGIVEDGGTKNQILEVAKNTAGVTEVIDLISTKD